MLIPERTTVIVNPAAGSGRVGRRWSQLEHELGGILGPVRFRKTEGPGHGTELARQAVLDGHHTLLSLGGDGTHNEVVNGFFDDGELLSPDAELAVVPTGTGGDLRRTLGLPNDALAAIDLVGDVSRQVDVGRLTYTTDGGGLLHQHRQLRGLGAGRQAGQQQQQGPRWEGQLPDRGRQGGAALPQPVGALAPG